MNDKIQQLAGQALDKIVPYTWTRLDYDEIQKLQEYFAELIVRECAELTLDYKNESYYNGWLDYRDEIKKHFGVEE